MYFMGEGSYVFYWRRIICVLLAKDHKYFIGEESYVIYWRKIICILLSIFFKINKFTIRKTWFKNEHCYYHEFSPNH